MHVRRNLLVFIGIGAGVLSCGANAQYDSDTTAATGANYGQTALSQSILTNTRAIGSRDKQSDNRRGNSVDLDKARDAFARAFKSAKPSLLATWLPWLSSGDISTGAFAPDPALTKKVIENFIQTEPYGERYPSIVRDFDANEALYQIAQSGQALRTFERSTQSRSLDPHNLADVVSVYYLCAWEIVNGSGISPQQGKAINSILAPAFAATSEMHKLNNAQKQELAVTYGLEIAFLSSFYSYLEKHGDTGALTEFRDEVYRNVLTQGIDLKRVAATDRGFVTH